MVEFSPGPWHSHPVTDSEFRNPSPAVSSATGPDFYIAAADGVCPAIVWDYLEIGKANARLIAAAPEMLEILQETVAQIENHFIDGDPVDHALWVADIRAVISKALGDA